MPHFLSETSKCAIDINQWNVLAGREPPTFPCLIGAQDA